MKRFFTLIEAPDIYLFYGIIEEVFQNELAKR